MKFQCRVVSQQFGTSEWNDFEIEDVLYSPRVSLEKADALLALYDPSEELLRFKGPKIWYTFEPSWHYHFHRHPIGKQLSRVLDKSEHVFYGNPDPRYKIAHPTYRGTLTTPRTATSKDGAAACVNNFGGAAWFLKKNIWLRNQMILCPLVELFGTPEVWAKFRHFPQLWIRRTPSNFRGRPVQGNGYFDEEYIRFLSQYKATVCLENCLEEDYFTEKFVNAVRAGCIPVYHAHPKVRKRFLANARWVDPADFGFSPARTIKYALEQDQAAFRRINDAWLKSGILSETDDGTVLTRLHRMIKSKLVNGRTL